MTTMYLDRPKARAILKEKLKTEDIESAAVALTGDERWNHETIYSGGKFRNRRSFKCYSKSYWATPVLIIYYKDGKEQRFSCWFDENDKRVKKINAQDKRRREKLDKSIERMMESIKPKS